MLFNSLAFLIFILAFFAGWRFVRNHNESRWVYLVAFSFFFYGWWDWRFVALLLMSGGIDYLAGLAIVRWPKYKLHFLVISMSGNVGSLALFKYLGFFLTNINWALTAMGCADQIPLARLILPIGISFYTFQSMSYTIDVYRGHLQPTRNVLHFFAFISIFPHLVAGPINRAVDLLPQLTKYVKPTEQVRWDGLKLIAMGYFKKMVIADNLAPVVNAAFSATVPLHDTLYWWVVMIMFAFQIYGDFSGYTDIARGLGKWIGYEFMVNFNHPYVSASSREFWTRWHISLSSWFRDYVYIPLGGSRKGVWQSHRNLWITMLISGLWHGANWGFAIWAALHSFYMSFERITRWPERVLRLRGGRHLATVIVFVLVLIAWVFFRAASEDLRTASLTPAAFGPRALSQATSILGIMFTLHAQNIKMALHLLNQNALTVLGLALAAEVVVHLRLKDPSLWIPRLSPAVAEVIFVAVLLTASIFLRGPGATFIYFQF